MLSEIKLYLPIFTGTATLNIRQNKFIAVRVIIYFFLTSLLNVILGITLGLVLNPGGVPVEAKAANTLQAEKLTLLDGLLDVGRWVQKFLNSYLPIYSYIPN